MRSIGLSVLLLLLQFGVAEAGDVAIASAAAVRAPLEAAAALSESEIGERLRTSYGTAGAVQDRVVGDGTIDIVVLPPARLDVLVRQGLVDPQTSPFGSVSLGLAVRTGAPKPLIATQADVETALLASPSIGLADPRSGATTGLFFARLLRGLGIADALKPRIRLFPDGTAAVEALARGEVTLVMGQMSEIKPVAGTDLVGPLPEPMQLRTVYAAGILAHAPRPVAAQVVIAFLRSPRTAPAFAAAGFDPPEARPARP